MTDTNIGIPRRAGGGVLSSLQERPKEARRTLSGGRHRFATTSKEEEERVLIKGLKREANSLSRGTRQPALGVGVSSCT